MRVFHKLLLLISQNQRTTYSLAPLTEIEAPPYLSSLAFVQTKNKLVERLDGFLDSKTVFRQSVYNLHSSTHSLRYPSVT